MHSYKHLFEKYIEKGNIDLAVKNAQRNKRKHRGTKRWLARADFGDYILNYAKNFKNFHHVPKEIYDGVQRKKRIIIVPVFPEQVVHHMVINILKGIIMRGMYKHSYGSIPNRGPHKGKKAIEKWIREDYDNCKYCLKLDIRKYFDSIDQEILYSKFERIIKDKRFLQVLETIISATDHGIPLGFHPSQWFANFYLQDFDHFVKEKLHAKYMIRYMDDIVIFDKSSEVLHSMQKEIEKYLWENLHLTLKPDWRVFRFDYMAEYANHYGSPLDFMGFKFYCNKTTLRKSILKKLRRKSIKIKKKGATVHSSRQMLSYMGYISHSATYDYYKDYVKDNINVRKMKKKVSNHQRRLNQDVRDENCRVV